MELHSVDSSNISMIGWENSVLRVTFKSGAVYDYFDISEDIYNELDGASSKGHYLAVNIKGVYNYKRVK